MLPVQASQGQTLSHAVPSPVVGAGFLRTAFGLLTPVITRAAQNYVLYQIEQWLAANAFRFEQKAAAGPVERVQAARGGSRSRRPDDSIPRPARATLIEPSSDLARPQG